MKKLGEGFATFRKMKDTSSFYPRKMTFYKSKLRISNNYPKDTFLHDYFSKIYHDIFYYSFIKWYISCKDSVSDHLLFPFL